MVGMVATIKFDREGLADYIESFRQDVEAGNLTIEEVKEQVMEHISDFIEIV